MFYAGLACHVCFSIFHFTRYEWPNGSSTVLPIPRPHIIMSSCGGDSLHSSRLGPTMIDFSAHQAAHLFRGRYSASARKLCMVNSLQYGGHGLLINLPYTHSHSGGCCVSRAR